MARIGYKVAKYNIIDETTKRYKALEGNNVPIFEKVVDEKFAPEFNNAELYANDGLAESDYSFKKGVLTVTIADDEDKLMALIFGNNMIETDEVSNNINDMAPFMGFGHIIPKSVNNKRKYKAEFFPKIKFSKITHDDKTRGESVEFGTTSLEATVFPLDEVINGLPKGTWEKHQTFDTLEDAETYLDSLLTPTVLEGE